MKILLGIQVTDEQFNYLREQQSTGKILKVIDGQVQAVEYQPSEQELYSQELTKLKHWFADTYTYQEQKYRRLIALDKLDDDGIDAQTKLTVLYDEAEQKRARIQELEKIGF